MNAAKSAVYILILAGPILAQRPLYSPPELGNAEGAGFAWQLGQHPVMQQQVCDGELRGRVANIKGLSFRRDDTEHPSHGGAGRTFAAVTLDIGEGEFDRFHSFSSANFTSTPQRVFSATVNWPTLIGTPASRPAVWGGRRGSYDFPFRRPWLYQGRRDIVKEWRFTGGTLTNGGAFTTNTYCFDSYGGHVFEVNRHTSLAEYPTPALTNNSPTVTSRCNDSSIVTNSRAAFMTMTAEVYGDRYPQAGLRGKLIFYTRVLNMSFSTPVIHAISLRADPIGVDLGTGCHRLHLRGPILGSLHRSAPSSHVYTSESHSDILQRDWSQACSDLEVVGQGAWIDTVTGRLALTAAEHIRLPSAKPAAFRRKAVLQYAGGGQAAPLLAGWAYPGVRYAR